MAKPITWRNVNAPDFTGASDMLARAGQSFQSALGALDTAKTDFEEGRTDRNTQAFLDQLSRYRTPEALRAAQDSGEINQLRQRLGSNGLIDQSQVNPDAIRNRLTTLRDRTTADYNYNQMVTQREQAPVIRQIQTAIANNDDATYERLMKENPDLHNAPELVQNYNTTERARLTQGREDRKYNQTRLMNNLVRRFSEASGDRGDTLSVRAFEQAAIDQGLDPAYIDQGVNMLASRFERDGQLYGDDKRAFDQRVQDLESKYGVGRSAFKGWEDTNPVEASQRVIDDFVRTDDDGNKFLFGMSDDDDRAAIVSEVMNYMRNGVPVRLDTGEEVVVPITESVAKQAMQGIRGGTWEFDSTFKDRVSELVRDGSLQEDFNNYQAYRTELSNLQANRLRFATRGRQEGNGTSQTGSVQQAPARPQQAPSQPARSQTPPASLARPAPELPVDTSVQGAADYLKQRADWKTRPSEQPRPQQSLMDTPMREIPGRISNWFNETLQQNQQRASEQGAAQLRRVLEQRTPMPRENFREMLARNPFGLRQLSSEELNRLRDTYGESLINQFLE